jgi:hypothetical protein
MSRTSIVDEFLMPDEPDQQKPVHANVSDVYKGHQKQLPPAQFAGD